MQRWYVVQTKPQRESVAIDNLERQGYTTYCPMITLHRRQRGRWQKTIGPLFPRYLFVQLDVGIDDFSPIRSTLGVSNMIRFGVEPATVPDDVIESIKQQEADAEQNFDKKTQWKAGDAVTIVEGPFAGLNGIYEKESTQERVIIMLDVLGKATKIKISGNSLVQGQ